MRAHVDAPEAVLCLLEEMLDPRPANRPRRAADVRDRARALARAKTAPPEKKAPAERKSAKKPTKGERRAQQRARRAETAPGERKEEPAKSAATPATEEPPRELSRMEIASAEADATIAAAGRRSVVMIAAMVVVPIVIVGGSVLLGGVDKAHPPVDTTGPGVPELYARPIVADVDGDGVEDMIVVNAIQQPLLADKEYPDPTWVKENGRFSPYVQAIRGNSGAVVYSLPLDKTYTSLGNEAAASERVVLVTEGKRLGVIRIPRAGVAHATVHDLATGKELASMKLHDLSGGACQNVDRSPGTFFLAHAGTSAVATGGMGTKLDLGTAAASSPDSFACAAGGLATANVADVPIGEVTDLTVWPARYSAQTTLRQGPHAGREARVGGGIGVLVVDLNRGGPESVLPSVTIDNGGDAHGRTDNGKVRIVAVDPKTGEPVFDRSLLALGLPKARVDHVEASDLGPLLFLAGRGSAGGLALVDPRTGEKKWSLALPAGARIASYTLSRRRAYLHVFSNEHAVYGFLSRKLGSRILVVDLASGHYERSLPAGSIEPEQAASASPPPYDPRGFTPVASCTCPLADGGTMQLGMSMRSSVESGGRKTFAVGYGVELGASGFVLPHYDERRARLSPPPTLENEMSMRLACGEDTIVFAHGTIATAWSLAKRDELWTVDVAPSGGPTRTVIGGGASLACALGTIEGGRVHLPGGGDAGAETVLSLKDGAALPAVSTRDAGAPRPRRP